MSTVLSSKETQYLAIIVNGFKRKKMKPIRMSRLVTSVLHLLISPDVANDGPFVTLPFGIKPIHISL